MKYDIGLVLVFNKNYGNNITNYALYSFLKKKGYKTLVIKQSLESFWTPREGYFGLFKNMPFDLKDVDTSRYAKVQYYILNDWCDIFIVGADQLWTKAFVDGTDCYTCLDWVSNKKKKIAYGTSFGMEGFDGNKEEEVKLGGFLQEFDNIFIREIEGKEYLEKRFDIKSKHVCDPVFFLNKNEYIELASRSDLSTPLHYLGGYILEESKAKDDLMLFVSRGLGLEKNVIIGNAMTPEVAPADSRIKLIYHAYIEDVLSVIGKCDFFVTDSYHGMCLAIIFHKDFIILTEEGNCRGYPRIKTLLIKLGLLERIVRHENIQKALELVGKHIDYSKVDKILGKWVEECKKDLSDSVEEPKKVLNNKNYDAELLHVDLEEHRGKKIKCIRAKWENICHEKKYDKRMTEPVIWGCGWSLQTNGFLFRDAINVRIVTDSNSIFWNKSVCEYFYCVPPQKVGTNSLIIIMVEDQNIYYNILASIDENTRNRCVWYKYFFENDRG